jgi:hypothetical protein
MKLDPGELEWSQPEACHRLYELKRDGEVIGTLGFEKLCGSLATGRFGESSWTLKRTGFLSPLVLVREAGSNHDLAVFTPTWTGGGALVLGSGRRLQLRSKNFWRTEWAFEAEDGTPAMALTGSSGLFKHGCHLTVTEFGATLPEAPLLTLLIWYVCVLMNEDAATVAAVSAVS